MKRTTLVWAVAGLGLALAFATAGCGGDDKESPPKQVEKPATSPAPTPPPTPTPAPTPASAPVAIQGDAKLGASIYATYCTTCHGAQGRGDGPLSDSLPVKPANHSDGAYMNGLADEYLVKVVSEGGPSVGKDAMMAPWGTTLTPEDIAHVVAFVRTLADPPYVAPAK